jgi:hypothetical protein
MLCKGATRRLSGTYAAPSPAAIGTRATPFIVTTESSGTIESVTTDQLQQLIDRADRALVTLLKFRISLLPNEGERLQRVESRQSLIALDRLRRTSLKGGTAETRKVAVPDRFKMRAPQERLSDKCGDLGVLREKRPNK